MGRLSLRVAYDHTMRCSLCGLSAYLSLQCDIQRSLEQQCADHARQLATVREEGHSLRAVRDTSEHASFGLCMAGVPHRTPSRVFSRLTIPCNHISGECVFFFTSPICPPLPALPLFPQVHSEPRAKESLCHGNAPPCYLALCCFIKLRARCLSVGRSFTPVSSHMCLSFAPVAASLACAAASLAPPPPSSPRGARRA